MPPRFRAYDKDTALAAQAAAMESSQWAPTQTVSPFVVRGLYWYDRRRFGAMTRLRWKLWTLLTLAAIAIFAAFLGWNRRAADARERRKPDALQASFGSFFSGGKSVAWDGKELIVTARTETGRETQWRRTPTPAQWTAFWADMDHLQVWAWDASYENRDQTDGLFWSVEMRHGGKIVRSHGYNAYPPDMQLVPTSGFANFWKAVETLAGQPLWNEPATAK